MLGGTSPNKAIEEARENPAKNGVGEQDNWRIERKDISSAICEVGRHNLPLRLSPSKFIGWRPFVVGNESMELYVQNVIGGKEEKPIHRGTCADRAKSVFEEAWQSRAPKTPKRENE